MADRAPARTAQTEMIAPARNLRCAWPRISLRRYKGSAVCTLVLLLVMTTAAVAGEFVTVQGPKVPGEYIVVFEPHARVHARVHALANVHNANVAEVWADINLALFTDMREADAQALAQDPSVKFVEEDGVVSGDAIIAQSPAPSWGLDRIDERDGLDDTFTYSDQNDGTGVSVYVFDTGIRTSHGDFEGRATVAYDAIGDGRNGQDCNGHGTHVSATVGGRVYGVAKAASLYAVRVLNCNNSGTVSGIVGAINWVTANRQDPAVANMSLGGGKSAALNEAVDRSSASGVFYVAAAGNSDANACNFSPGSAASAFTVGSSTRDDQRAFTSNWGSCVRLFAPGQNITSAWIESDTASRTISGTSMAAPHVAGVAAMILEQCPSCSPAEVAAELTRIATPGRLASVEVRAGSPNLLLYVFGLSQP